MSTFKPDKRAIEGIQKEIAKEFERAARKHPVRVPVQVDSPSMDVASQTEDRTEADPHLSRLLVWLGELDELQPGHYVRVSSFVEMEELPVTDGRVLALQLEKRGFVRSGRSYGMGNDPQVLLTDQGRLEVRRLQTLRRDRTARLAHACNALLRWLFESASESVAVEVMAFVEVPGSYFAGESLTVDEIMGALDYLEKRKLVRRIRTDNEATSIRAEVTESGTDCTLSGRTVSDYVSRQLSAGDTYHIAESSGFVAGSQDNVVQNNSFGFDPSELKQFADLVMQFAPALGIPAEQQANLIQDAENLADEAASGDLAPGKIRAAYERVQTALEAITTTTAGLTLLAEKGHEAYRAVFGG